MTHTYSNILIHTVWSTKERGKFIIPSIKDRLYGYLNRVSENQGVKVLAINGTIDHVHVLFNISPTISY